MLTANLTFDAPLGFGASSAARPDPCDYSIFLKIKKLSEKFHFRIKNSRNIEIFAVFSPQLSTSKR